MNDELMGLKLLLRSQSSIVSPQSPTFILQIAGLAIFGLTLLLIIFRPKRINEAIAALGGAVLMVVFGVVGPDDALGVLVEKWDVFFFFLGLMTIAVVAESAGFFEWAATMAGIQARGSGLRLFINVFLLGTIISTFFSNDATALILTPVVYSLVTRLRLNPLPFMFACTFIADTASFVLPVSNPINILVLGQFPAGLPDFLKHLLLPSLICVGLNLLFFILIFRKDLPKVFEGNRLEKPEQAIPDPAFFRYTVVCLGLVAVGYVVASLVHLPLSFIALGGGALLLGGGLAMRRLTPPKLATEISWPLFGFIAGMFIVVRGVENIGVTAELGRLIIGTAGDNLFLLVLFTTFGVAIGANLINNVPMTLVMLSAIGQQAATLSPQLHQGVVFSTIFGADLGPNLTTVGSLATVLWLVILRRKGLEVSSVQYFKVGILVTPVMLGLGALSIWLSLLF